MSDEHITTVDRLTQFGTQRRDLAAERMQQAKDSVTTDRGTLLAERRVLDLVTGIDGVILGRTAATPTPFGAFPVRLDTGDVVTRFPKELFARPTPPRA